MSQYIYFTEEQKTQARQTDIVSLLKSQGETVKRSGSEYEWKDGSQKVTLNMSESAVMQLILFADSITNLILKQWNFCLVTVAVRS